VETCSQTFSKTWRIFPKSHGFFSFVQFGLRPDSSKHHIRVCVCLTDQFAFFSRADSGVLLATINVQFKCPLLPSPSINPPRMSSEIKQHPPPEYRQLKTIRTLLQQAPAALENFACPS
jgi:hypothetical protein